ncbi:MAG: IS4 family transposase [Chloroflexi bacterium]|nr:IS4 family transposase [Chloroflexota bacterium]
MARAPQTSIASPPAAHQQGLNRRQRRWLGRQLRNLRGRVAQAAARCQADRYRKHFDAYAHLCLLLFHGLSAGRSLRQSYGAFAACPGLVAVSGLGGADYAASGQLAVSFSQFAASNSSRPAAFLAALLPGLLREVLDRGLGQSAALPADRHLLDGTFLRISLKLAPWLCPMNSKHLSGVRLQVRYRPAFDLPEQILITTTRVNDGQALDQMILQDPEPLQALAEQTLIFDRGYYSHRRFAALLAAHVHLLTRLHPQAAVTVIAECAVQQPLSEGTTGRITITHDQQITLGSANNRAGAVLPQMRLVSAVVQPLPQAASQGSQAVTYRIVTDRWDLTAVEVIQAYLWRWPIELFFRWLKSHLQITRLLGYSRHAVELTVWLALLVHLLVVLAVHDLGRLKRSLTLLQQLAHLLGHLTPDDVLAEPDEQPLPLPNWGTVYRVPP